MCSRYHTASRVMFAYVKIEIERGVAAPFIPVHTLHPNNLASPYQFNDQMSSTSGAMHTTCCWLSHTVSPANKEGLGYEVLITSSAHTLEWKDDKRGKAQRQNIGGEVQRVRRLWLHSYSEHPQFADSERQKRSMWMGRWC